MDIINKIPFNEIITTLMYVERIAKLIFNKLSTVPQKEDEFLIYNPDYLINIYKSESPVIPGLPYSQIEYFLDSPSKNISVNILQGDFRLREGGSNWDSISKAGFSALLEENKIYANESMIHLENFEKTLTQLILNIQKACYYDQAKSNLILDWPTKSEFHQTTLRDLLIAEYNSKLPLLTDARLANTIGVACVIFYKDKGNYIPYLVQRVEKVGAYPGGIHCTASGAANWPKEKTNDFDSIFVEAMRRELLEEVGLERQDMYELKPIALCREFLRGGKPQIFFGGFTNLPRASLKDRRINASKRIIETRGWAEIEKDNWLKRADVVLTPNQIENKIKKYGVTIEAAGAYYYAQQFLDSYLKW